MKLINSDSGDFISEGSTVSPRKKSNRRTGDSPGSIRFKVLKFIKRKGKKGATDEEIEKHLKVRHQTGSARRRELVLKGLVVDSTKTRATSSGRPAIVWVVAPEGHEADLVEQQELNSLRNSLKNQINQFDKETCLLLEKIIKNHI